jgi:hypothetical protein
MEPPICTVPPDIVKLVGITPVTAVALQQPPTLPVITDPVPLMATPAPPRIAKLAKSLPRIGLAEALGAVVTWITADAAAQRRNVLTLRISFKNAAFHFILFHKTPASLFDCSFVVTRLFSRISATQYNLVRSEYALEPIFCKAQTQRNRGVEQL